MDVAKILYGNKRQTIKLMACFFFTLKTQYIYQDSKIFNITWAWVNQN